MQDLYYSFIFFNGLSILRYVILSKWELCLQNTLLTMAYFLTLYHVL